MDTAFAKAQNESGSVREKLIREDVFRATHDMKGQGATFGYDLITTVGNHLCRYVERQTNFDDVQMIAIEAHIRFLHQIVDEKITGNGGKKGSEILKQVEVF